jgi:hypothetical protein
MKRLGVQALARIWRGGASNGTAQAKALTPNGLDAVANLPCALVGQPGILLIPGFETVTLPS